MPVTRMTKDNGTVIKLGPMLTAEPELTITDEQLEEMATDKEGNPAFLADTIASFQVHENMGINLYRTLHGLTQNPVLQPKFAQLIDDSITATDAYQTLMTALGIPVGYVSPAGRCQEAMDQHLIASLLTLGSADPVTKEMAAVNATLVASSMCVANVELLETIGESLQDETARSAIGTAVQQLAGPSQQHLEWAKNARATMAQTLGQSKTTHKAATVAEKAFGKVKDALT
jgi:hypothetical protein